MEMVTLNYATSFVSLLTNGMVSLAINDTSTLLLSMIKTVVNDYTDFKNIIEKIDLTTKLNIIENFMNIIPKEYENIKCVSTSLNSLHEIVIKLYDELAKINYIIEQHKEKWFNYYRKPNYHIELDNIQKYKLIMDDRFDTLLKLINTINFLK
tara:strand:+ start:54 stop:512 length:459 start_codon:yes stop_codon:yes gene_type:complete